MAVILTKREASQQPIPTHKLYELYLGSVRALEQGLHLLRVAGTEAEGTAGRAKVGFELLHMKRVKTEPSDRHESNIHRQHHHRHRHHHRHHHHHLARPPACLLASLYLHYIQAKSLLL
mgnify:CR=1 FL=1